jgi:choline kinase
MKAIMLAAGKGSRLSGGDDEHPPKALLEFGGLTLLERHIRSLTATGVESLTLVVGYRAADIVRALDDLRVGGFVRVVENKAFQRGSLVSLWTARDALTSGGGALFMDADVLYPPALLERLVRADAGNAILYDRRLEPGEEPIKIGLKGGWPVDFGRKVSVDCDEMGEWVGFLKLSEPYALKLANIVERFIDQGRMDDPMEEAVRELLASSPRDAFAIVDVSDLAWIEIDFPDDVARARDEILPALEQAGSDHTR